MATYFVSYKWLHKKINLENCPLPSSTSPDREILREIKHSIVFYGAIVDNNGRVDVISQLACVAVSC